MWFNSKKKRFKIILIRFKKRVSYDGLEYLQSPLFFYDGYKVRETNHRY